MICTLAAIDTKAGPKRKRIVAATVVCGGGRINGPGGRDRVIIDLPH